MQLVRLLVMFSLVLPLGAVPARAQAPEAPSTLYRLEGGTALRLLGRGIRDADTGAALSLECLDDGCLQLRWVVHVSRDEVYTLGESLAPGVRRDLPGYLKRIHQFARKESNSPFFGFALYLAGGAMMLTGFITMVVPLVYTGAGTMLGTAFPAANHWLRSPKAIWTTDGAARLTDQDGWDWASTPRKCSHKYFASVFRQVARTAVWESWDPRDRGSKFSDPLRDSFQNDTGREILALVARLKAEPREKSDSWAWNSGDPKFRFAE